MFKQTQQLSVEMFFLANCCIQGPKKCERGPKYECFKNKRQGCTSKTKVDCLYRNVTKKFLNLTPTPKIAPKGPKKCERGPKYGCFKNKRQSCTFKTKVDYLQRNITKKFLNLTSTPKIALKGKKGQKRPQLCSILSFNLKL